MKESISKPETIGNEIMFPVADEKQQGALLNARNLFLKFLMGYLVIATVTFGIRCTFFINAVFTEGVVTEVPRSLRGHYSHPFVTFLTDDNKRIKFAAVQNLKLNIGEQVNVIYKKNNPQRAAIYSFFGFWFNAILICQVLVFFWVGLLVVYYGDYP